MTMISFPLAVQAALQDIYRNLSTYVLPQIRKLNAAGISAGMLDSYNNIMELWCALLTFGKWLGLAGMLQLP
jgi:hypothetical protein